MTYSDLVMWVWLIALTGTVAGLALAGRAILRAEAALAQVGVALDGVGELAPAGADLGAATRRTAGARVRLHTDVDIDA